MVDIPIVPCRPSVRRGRFAGSGGTTIKLKESFDMTAWHFVASIVLAGIILYELRTAVIALNNAERYYTSFTLVLASAVMCIAILTRY
jgi:hypothetical protein